MIMAFCEDHNKFETVTYSADKHLEAYTLNEQSQGSHHFTDATRAYLHEGQKNHCERCK